MLIQSQFSVSRHAQYGAGIHKQPDEFPPEKELVAGRYHYARPKLRMPVNVFLHYLHRARWHSWSEHTEDIWLRRLPKKLKKSVLTEVKQDPGGDPERDYENTTDADLAFGWGVHILDGPNHAVLALLLACGIVVAFTVAGLVVGFAKTQEQGFSVGAFFLTVTATVMSAIYFRLLD